jgi:DNA-binding transcriptional regulator YdaS (Cro superfamily)
MTLEEAIEKAGNATKLAQYLGITVANISQWKKRGSIPKKHLAKLEELGK